MHTDAHRCLFDHELEAHVFMAMRRHKQRMRRLARASLGLALLASPGWAIGAQAAHALAPLTLGWAFSLSVLGLGLFIASRRQLTYPEAFVAAGLEPLTLGEHLEVAAITASVPDLRADLAVWTGYDLVLRQRDLQALRRRAAQHISPYPSSWTNEHGS